MSEGNLADKRMRLTNVLRHPDYVPGPVDRDALIHELTTQRETQTSSQFNLTFLDQLEQRPEEDVADIWDDVERHFAGKNQTRMRKNPYRTE